MKIKSFCNLLSVQGVVGGTHFTIAKLTRPLQWKLPLPQDKALPCDFSCFIDNKKQFINHFVGLLKNVDKPGVLQKLGFHIFTLKLNMGCLIWKYLTGCQYGISSYLLRDKGAPFAFTIHCIEKGA